MASFNQVTLIGRVGSVDVKVFANGGKIVEMGLATSSKWKGKDGQMHEETQWHKLVVGGPASDFAEKYIEKGDLLHVQGMLCYRSYDKQGVTVVVAEVRCQNIQKLTPKRDDAPVSTTPIKTGPDKAPEVAPEAAPEGTDDLPF